MENSKQALLGMAVEYADSQGRLIQMYFNHLTGSGMLAGHEVLPEDPITGRPGYRHVRFMGRLEEGMRRESGPLGPGEWRYLDQGQSI